MEQTATSKRLHPLLATAAVAVTVFSLAGIAAMTGVLPASHSEPAAVAPTETQASALTLAPQSAVPTAPVASSLGETSAPPTAARHDAPRRHETVRDAVRAESGQAARHEPRPESRSEPRPEAPQPQVAAQPAPQQAPQSAPQSAPQNSALGIGIGAVVGGLIGNQVGGGNGKKLATVAGAIGGGFLGNEIAKRNQQPEQQPASQQ